MDNLASEQIRKWDVLHSVPTWIISIAAVWMDIVHGKHIFYLLLQIGSPSHLSSLLKWNWLTSNFLELLLVLSIEIFGIYCVNTW